MAAFAPAGASLPPGGLNFLLLGCAREPDAPETRALARAIALTWGWPLGPASGVLGLPETDSRALFDQHFPGALALLTGVHALGAPIASDPRIDEFADLADLLLGHRKDQGAGGAWIARAVAGGCMGDNHLWEDLGLASRANLSALLGAHFPTLVARNTHNLRWKRFFYRQLCQRAEISLCKAPSCGVCSDYAACFGGDDDHPLSLSRLG
ncbi:MAG: hypothetical protein AMXMBFR76_02480 [Pseudomonadota bacterium]